MGSVWLAARSDGRFESQVAVKLLNAALIGRGGDARFKREGTILARLTHPNIARLIDAGVSATGQPYLVLERIDGRHIDAYCNEHRLDARQRIRLFLDVQAAVAHAHANLIVHRDLKPSNILVTAEGQVKLLDFGIAKLLEHDDGPIDSLVTRDGAALTPKYAAPEQITGGPITTATDVYALGVVLYELLTGQHPAGDAATTSSGLVKAIVETEPLPLADRSLRGDLETILRKALKKAPEERYASVVEFADDLRRYVEHQPIGARPDTVSYRAAKFVRRHRRALAASVAAALALAGLVSYYTIRLAAERDRATLEAAKALRVSELLTGLLSGADPFRTPDAKEPTVRNLLDLGAQRVDKELADQPELQAELFALIGRTYERMGLHVEALPLLERALSISRRAIGESVQLAQSLNNLGVLHRGTGNVARAEPLLRESLDMRRRVLGREHPDVAITAVELSRVLQDRGEMREAEVLAREGLTIRQKVFGDEHRETATSKNELGLIRLQLGDLEGAEPLLRQNLATNQRLLGMRHASTATSMANLALVLGARGALEEAEKLFRESLEITRGVFGDNHVSFAHTLNNLAVCLEMQGRLDEAQALLERSLRIAGPQLAADHPRMLIYTTNLARIRITRGDGAATETQLRDILAARQRLYPEGDWRIAQVQALLGASLLAQHRDAEAEALMRSADANLKPVAGIQARERLANRARLVALYERSARPQLAANFR